MGWRRSRLWLACLAGWAGLGAALPAGAASIQTLLTPFTGTSTSVLVSLMEDAGDIVFTLSVEQGLGDLRGVFFDIADDGLLPGLDATGDFVSDIQTGSVINLGNGNNLIGGGSPCPCDVGVALGTPGMSPDDILATSFRLSHDTQSLSLALFFEQAIGVRVTSVGDALGRGGSSKLGGMLPVPEPSTALLLALGLALVAAPRRRC